jgi:hypothetical protein
VHNRKFVGTVNIGRKTYYTTKRGEVVIGVVVTVGICVSLYLLETVIYLLGGR